MIYDSIPWKTELLKISDRLVKRKTQRRWTELTGFLVERNIMVAAYAIRKLLEARKISDSLAARKVIVTRYSVAPGSSTSDAMNRYFIWENYDLNIGEQEEFSLLAACNQIIHSWNWMISATEAGQFDGVYVSSDRARKSSIYFVSVDMLIDLLRAIGSEDVVALRMERDASGEMHIVEVVGGDMRQSSIEP